MDNDEPIRVTLLVAGTLERLGVNYLIGGSLASALHGAARATMDTDIVAEMRDEHVEAFVEALSSTFYLDTGMIRDAIHTHGSFNIIHLESLFKVDIFIPKERKFDRLQMTRRSPYVLSTEPEQSAYVASAEDIILAKLEWYRLGGEVSERQWRDILGVMKIQTGRLDLNYLKDGAGMLEVTDLLERAIKEAE